MHHMGVDRMLFLARKVIPNINREEVRQIVRTCNRCQSIDPALSVHEAGEIQVSRIFMCVCCSKTSAVFRHAKVRSKVSKSRRKEL